jgi:hypothetical protein
MRSRLRRFSRFSAFFDSSCASSELSSSSASVLLLSARSSMSASSSSGLGEPPAMARNFSSSCCGGADGLLVSTTENWIWISPVTTDFFLPERRDSSGYQRGSCWARALSARSSRMTSNSPM